MEMEMVRKEVPEFIFTISPHSPQSSTPSYYAGPQLFLQPDFNQCQYLVTIREVDGWISAYLDTRNYHWIMMRDETEDCPGYLMGRRAKNSSLRYPFLNDKIIGTHTHFLIWWKEKDYKYFSQTKIYRWLQSQRENWTIERRKVLNKTKYDCGEYFNTFKLDNMVEAFLIFDHKPPSRQFCAYQNPHPTFTLIQNEINRQIPNISDMTAENINNIMMKISKEKFFFNNFPYKNRNISPSPPQGQPTVF